MRKEKKTYFMADDTVYWEYRHVSRVGCTISPEDSERISLLVVNETKEFIWNVDQFVFTEKSLYFAGAAQTDEWMVVYLLLRISSEFPWLELRAWDSDGEFLLIEAAHLLPDWMDPEVMERRVWIKEGFIWIQNPDGVMELQVEISECIKHRAAKFHRNIHIAKAKLPRKIASILHAESHSIAKAAYAFINRTPEQMKQLLQVGIIPADTDVSVKMTRLIYAQLQASFSIDGSSKHDSDVGLKISVGFALLEMQGETFPVEDQVEFDFCSLPPDDDNWLNLTEEDEKKWFQDPLNSVEEIKFEQLKELHKTFAKFTEDKSDVRGVDFISTDDVSLSDDSYSSSEDECGTIDFNPDEFISLLKNPQPRKSSDNIEAEGSLRTIMDEMDAELNFRGDDFESLDGEMNSGLNLVTNIIKCTEHGQGEGIRGLFKELGVEF